MFVVSFGKSLSGQILKVAKFRNLIGLKHQFPEAAMQINTINIG